MFLNSYWVIRVPLYQMCGWLPVTLSPGSADCLYYLDYGKINNINKKDE
jgi:hypothetical protein